MNIILTEEQIKRVLSEKLEDMINVHPIYHYTTSQSAKKIIDSDMLLGSDDSGAWDDEKLKSSKHGKYISFTRDRNFDLTKHTYGIGGNVIDQDLDDMELSIDVVFVINRDKLKTRYKLEPFSYEAMVGVYDDYEDDESDEILNDYNQKDKEKEERVLIDKIAPLRPYVMDIIYNGPDEILKAKIKKYLGKPSYIGKPRVRFEKFNNWVSPSADDIKRSYYGDSVPNNEGAHEYFDSMAKYTKALKEARIIKIEKFGDEYINGRTQLKTQRKLINKFPDKKDMILSLYERFNNNEPVTIPIIVVSESGDRFIVTGNIVMDIAFQLGIEPRVLFVKTDKEIE